MAQFDVFQLPDGEWVVDVQSELTDVAWTTVVIPLVRPDADIRPIHRLNPIFTIAGERRILAAQLLGVVPASLLKKKVGSLATREYEIKAAFDVLVTGI